MKAMFRIWVVASALWVAGMYWSAHDRAAGIAAGAVPGPTIPEAAWYGPPLALGVAFLALAWIAGAFRTK
jgi:hypothetical protein